MSSDPAASAASDPLKAVADAMDAAVKAAKDGAEDARATAADAMSAPGEMLSKFVYKACYTAAYGVVFPSAFVARSIPKDNALVHGLIDGAHAAMDMVHEMKSKTSG